MQATTRRTAKKPVIGIIGGTSPFGQWFKSFFEKNGCTCLVAGRRTALTPRALAEEADIVIVSVPIRATADTIRAVRDCLKPGALLCDFTSIKTLSLREMLKSDTTIGVTGIHPMFGPLATSLTGQNIIFCPGRDNRWVIFLKNLFKRRGGIIVEMTAVEHDKQMALVQALTHFANIALAKVMYGQANPRLDISTPVFRQQTQTMSRILGADPALYADIQIGNKYFKKLMDRFIAESKKLRTMVEEGQDAAFEKNYRALARVTAQRLTKKTTAY